MSALPKFNSVEEFEVSEFARKEKSAQFKDGEVHLKLMAGSEISRFQSSVCIELFYHLKKPRNPNSGWWLCTEIAK